MNLNIHQKVFTKIKKYIYKILFLQKKLKNNFSILSNKIYSLSFIKSNNFNIILFD